MSDQPVGNSLADMLFQGRLGNQGGSGGGGAGAGMVVNAATGALGINLVDTPGLLADTQNGHLSMTAVGLETLSTNKFFGLDLSDLFSRLTGDLTDHTEGVGASDGGGGGNYDSGDSGIDTSGGSSGSDDFQVRSGGNFVGEGFQAEHVSDHNDIRPSATPDMRGGGEMSMSMD